MTRSLVALALATQMPFSAWADEDNRVIETAWELIEERDRGLSDGSKRDTYGSRRDERGRVMGG